MYSDEIPVGKAEDLTGKQFGAWKVLYRTYNIGKSTAWKCRCEKCGIEKPVRRDQLMSGKNLGCIHCGTKVNLNDISGRQIGDLLVLEATDNRSNGAVVWKCQDINTNEIIYRRTDLVYTYQTKKNNKSLNFNAMSKAEIIIYLILKFNNITFERQKAFNSCRFKSTNALAKFDFWVNNQYIIEYDGEPHFQEIEFFGNLSDKQEHDKIKNQWCKDNNIPLIRIPYWHLNDICIEDLLLETSEFVA